MCVCVPAEGAVLLCKLGAHPAPAVVFLTLGPFLTQRGGDVARGLVLGRQELVELGGCLGRGRQRAAAVGHLEEGIDFGVTATTWRGGGEALCDIACTQDDTHTLLYERGVRRDRKSVV